MRGVAAHTNRFHTYRATIVVLQMPHTESKYPLRVMGFQIARKHVHNLRRIAFVSSFVLPIVLSAAAMWTNPMLCLAAFTRAVPCIAIGNGFERGLFFADARRALPRRSRYRCLASAVPQRRKDRDLD